MKLDQLHDLEHGEIVGFIQGYLMAAGKADPDPLDVEVRTQFPALDDETAFLEAMREASYRLRKRGEQMASEADVLEQLGKAARKLRAVD